MAHEREDGIAGIAGELNDEAVVMSVRFLFNGCLILLNDSFPVLIEQVAIHSDLRLAHVAEHIPVNA